MFLHEHPRCSFHVYLVPQSATIHIISTTTGAAKAASLVLPELKGKMTAMSYRVPVIKGSIVEINCLVRQSTATEGLSFLLRLISLVFKLPPPHTPLFFLILPFH